MPLTALHGFCDADWVGCKDDRHSTSGFAIYMGANLLSWGAKKQATISRSTAEAEHRALASTTTELIWFTNLLKSIGYCLPPLKLYCDNISAITMARIQCFIIAQNILKSMFISLGNVLLVVPFCLNMLLALLKLQTY